MDWEEAFSKANPVKIKDTDVFLHGTSSKKYLDIKSTGFLKRKASATNWGISKNGICLKNMMNTERTVEVEQPTSLK